MRNFKVESWKKLDAVSGKSTPILIILLLTFSLTKSYSQSDSLKGGNLFENGVKTIGIQHFYVNPRYFQYNPSLSYGVFLLNKLNLGAELEFSTLSYYKWISIEPYCRYYILNRKISPFIEANYSFGYFHQTNGHAKNSPGRWMVNGVLNSFYGGTGVSFKMSNKVGMELFGGREYRINNYIGNTWGGEVSKFGWTRTGIRVVFYIK